MGERIEQVFLQQECDRMIQRLESDAAIEEPAQPYLLRVPATKLQQGEIVDPEIMQKERGGYYTPEPIAQFLAEWAIHDPNSKVLEPSAGDGQLVMAAERHLSESGHVVAIELYATEADKIRRRSGDNVDVVNGDFFTWFRDHAEMGCFDVVLGNPPFIRYQHFREDHRQIAFELMRLEGLHPSRLTNAWLPFVVVATRVLREGGRLALVLPAELLQVTYAGELREYLARNYSHLTVVTFRELVFDGILQETVLLLGIRGSDSAADIAFVELNRVDELSLAPILLHERVEVDLDHAREKWTQYYLTSYELDLIREIERSSSFGVLGTYADIDVGIVTGRNEFFVMTKSESVRLGIDEWTKPLIGRSFQIPGLVLTEDDWKQLSVEDSKCYLLQLGDRDRDDLSASALSYVIEGEEKGFHRGYKCSIRLPRWWKVPSDWTPDAFLLRQIYDGPRIIANGAKATSTDTIHRVKVHDGIDVEWLSAASMNSLTFAFSEIRGRSYGGGVLELEPTEAEALPFPKPDGVVYSLSDLDSWCTQHGVESTLDVVDSLFLEPTGISGRDVETLRSIWRKLYQRRMSRKKR